MNSKSVKEGVAEAMDFWLSQHDVSVPEMFQQAIKEAVGEWLSSHGDEIIEAIAEGGKQ